MQIQGSPCFDEIPVTFAQDFGYIHWESVSRRTGRCP